MLDPFSSFVRLARPTRLLAWITCIVFALMIWPFAALADDPNTSVTTGIPIVDAILKVLGAIYAILSAILLILPKTSGLAQGLAKFAIDAKGAAAVKEAKTGAMAARLKRESTIPPPRGFAEFWPLLGLTLMTITSIALGVWALGCKSNAARTACDIVHIVDDGCEVFVNVPLPDGTVERVPRAAIVQLASETKAARLSGATP
jgi:hypothetical protein